jgi:hypothetical protein
MEDVSAKQKKQRLLINNWEVFTTSHLILSVAFSYGLPRYPAGLGHEGLSVDNLILRNNVNTDRAYSHLVFIIHSL